ncbi:GTP-binding protein [Gordonia sp. ABSL11-1]|uniref:CobW family GTP-binding protein n=1 Tax=Gordonia sp. ABSL11-1 TaxID=3053924 RepID=UPI0025740377|nr:GTP-binding protein [Gordonia sp. ABSL11-1]MDL9947633.1 GTP-binding protein [Gordonia sp. ABSL11-1]
MSRRQVPVIVVAGFLGSGKTTLLNHLLRQASGSRIGVLVNDFGSINIDAMLIAGQTDGTVSMSNGCMCCSVDADGVEDALTRLLRPSAQIDAIVIEASGIAEPRALIRMITGFADPRLRYGGLVYVVDAAQFADLRVRHPEIDRHIQIADLVVVNKTDLVGEAQIADVRALVAASNDTAPMIATADAVVDPEMLFDARRRSGDDSAPRHGQLTLDELLAEDSHAHPTSGGEDHRDHLHERYQSVEFVSDAPMNPRRLAEFLERPPAGCYRIKGVVAFDVPGHRQKFIVHGVGGFVRVERRAWGGAQRATSIVVIGAGVDPDAVHTALTCAVDDGVPDEHGILSITRHLVTAP